MRSPFNTYLLPDAGLVALVRVRDEMDRRYRTPAFAFPGAWQGLRDWLSDQIDNQPARPTETP